LRVWDRTFGSKLPDFQRHILHDESEKYSSSSLPPSDDQSNIAVVGYTEHSSIQIAQEHHTHNLVIQPVDIVSKDLLPWSINDDCWLVSIPDSAPLLWLPAHLRSGLYTPETSMIISSNGTTKVSFDNAKLGIHWAECYTPHSN
jgi:hypothetical protein